MIKKLNYLIILTLFTFQLHGQGYVLYSGFSETEKGIPLKWYSKKVNLNAGFDIYRQDAGSSNWKKLNTIPVQRAKPLTEAAIDAEGKSANPNTALINYSMAFLDKQEEWNNNYSMLLLSAIADNKLASLCGIYYLDATASDGKKYNYKITESGKTVSLATISQVDMSKKPLESVSGWEVKEGNKSTSFNFNYNPLCPLYKIYRSLVGGKADTVLFILPSEENIKATAAKKFPYSDDSKNLQIGSSYSYAISCIDYFGNESPKTAAINVVIKDLSAPASATGLVASYTKDNQIIVKWNKPLDNSKIALLKSDKRKGPFDRLAINKDTFYIDKQIKESSSYFYTIETTSTNDIKTYTDTFMCSTPDITPPAIPSGLAIQADTGKIVLRWNKNTETDLQGYFVFRALTTDPDNFTPLLKMPLTNNMFIDELPKEASNYFVYKICAVDNAYNRSAHTAAVAARMPDVVAPAPTQLIECNLENNRVKLTWNQIYDRDLMSYELYRGTPINDSTICNYILLTSGKTVLNYIDKNIGEKGVWSYYVITVDSSGNKSKSMERKIEINATEEAIEIKNLKAQKEDGLVKLSWSNSKKMKVQLMRKSQAGTFVALFPPQAIDTFEDKQIKTPNTYEYKIRCFGEDDSIKDGEVTTVTYE